MMYYLLQQILSFHLSYCTYILGNHVLEKTIPKKFHQSFQLKLDVTYANHARMLHGMKE